MGGTKWEKRWKERKRVTFYKWGGEGVKKLLKERDLNIFKVTLEVK